MRRVSGGARTCAIAGTFLAFMTWSGCVATGHPEPDAAKGWDSASLLFQAGPAETPADESATAMPDEGAGGAVCVTEDGAPFESESC